MKQLFLGFGATLLIAVLSVAGLAPNRVYALDTNDFTITQFDADYYLDKDSEGRSTLKTIERITADFPAIDQNHGIERALPQSYDGHSTSLNVTSVKDESGADLQFSQSESNDNLVLRIGDANTYVHGNHTYVIAYTQRDVTKFFADTNDDELYWDVNGTQWSQVMKTVSARVHVASSVMISFSDKSACYRGAQGSATKCDISSVKSGEETTFSVLATNLGAGENVTFAIGFAPHSFAEYQMTAGERMWALIMTVWVVLLVIGSVAAIAVLVWMIVKYYKAMHGIKGRGTIIPEYVPPKDASVLVSAKIINNSTSDVTAQLLDFAVRHYLKIYQTKEKSLFSAAEYELEVVKDISDLHKEEQELLKALFGESGVAVGSRFAMKRLREEYELRNKLTTTRKSVREYTRGEYGLYERAMSESRLFKIVGIVTIITGVVTVSPLLIVTSIVAFVFASVTWPLTKKGVGLRDYLAGLKDYINVAEEERLKMLQSPKGAEKVGAKVDGNDARQLVKLYERVLPYAVLFGSEREWSKQLGAYYKSAGQQPDWYSGNGAFNAAMFTSMMIGFSSQSSSYSSATSASSGGAGGGGFSGGGGGGGGGGGW
jgi:uncharacterized membrane protein YgcG